MQKSPDDDRGIFSLEESCLKISFLYFRKEQRKRYGSLRYRLPADFDSPFLPSGSFHRAADEADKLLAVFRKEVNKRIRNQVHLSGKFGQLAAESFFHRIESIERTTGVIIRMTFVI